MSKDIPKDVLGAINKKTGKNISENTVKKLASGVDAKTLQNEAELRKLIKQVSDMAKIKVPESTVNDIVKAVKSSGMSPSSMETLVKMMMKK
ncbi:stage VI sporulation protein F [Paenibacillus sp. GSMTC-2017]|uniref:stage VI sporulation protein F n=1 Tax=Paenibacillus sp. GSMTC-2017 TaxID=2794350 RepID=UPI0018D5D714|nr:stage VI sporulation protein F [Paenibacillus sp. GSMTC-2017]MBH5317972.1 stage VI sporulation protein F [Paenibacillus sp. GSMTC-2017]